MTPAYALAATPRGYWTPSLATRACSSGQELQCCGAISRHAGDAVNEAFTSGEAKREMCEVNADHRMSRLDDGALLYQLLESLA